MNKEISSQCQQYFGNFNMPNRTKTPKNAIVGFRYGFLEEVFGVQPLLPFEISRNMND